MLQPSHRLTAYIPLASTSPPSTSPTSPSPNGETRFSVATGGRVSPILTRAFLGRAAHLYVSGRSLRTRPSSRGPPRRSRRLVPAASSLQARGSTQQTHMEADAGSKLCAYVLRVWVVHSPHTAAYLHRPMTFLQRVAVQPLCAPRPSQVVERGCGLGMVLAESNPRKANPRASSYSGFASSSANTGSFSRAPQRLVNSHVPSTTQPGH